MEEHRLPLGLCKQAFMKFQSAIQDLEEILGDEDLNDDERYEFYQMIEVGTMISLRLMNIVKKEMNEDDFVNEDIEMDSLEEPTYEDCGEPVELDILSEEI